MYMVIGKGEFGKDNQYDLSLALGEFKESEDAGLEFTSDEHETTLNGRVSRNQLSYLKSFILITFSNELSQKKLDEMDLLAKLEALKGATLDDAAIAELMAAAGRSKEGPNTLITTPKDSNSHEMDQHSVDDLLVASRAAEMELASLKRYFNNPRAVSGSGVDGLADEILSSDSDDEVEFECKNSDKSALDKLLEKNSLTAIGDDEGEQNEESAFLDEIDTLNIPTSVMIPYGARIINLGTVQAVVDGLLVIGEVNPLDEAITGASTTGTACEVESLVFLSDSEPFTVVGMIVDTLGSVKRPMHLVLVSNKDLLLKLKSVNDLVGRSVCTIDSHSKLVEIDECGDNTFIKGAPQLGYYEDCDDDGADDDDIQPTNHITPKPTSHSSQFGYGYRHH
jgi:hypothetical protein